MKENLIELMNNILLFLSPFQSNNTNYYSHIRGLSKLQFFSWLENELKTWLRGNFFFIKEPILG